MTKANPTNPYTRDETHTQKEVPMPFKKAKVLDVKGRDEDGFHIVTVRCYGDQAPYDAPVLAPMEGCIWVPEKDSDVIVLFTDEDKPVVIGQWYALDRVEDNEVLLPPYDPGDIRLGNSSGSHVTIKNDGSIKMSTGEYEPIDIDFQSASVRMSSNQSVPGGGNYHVVEFDTVEDDPEDLFDPDAHTLNVRHAGQHRIEATVEVPVAGQNNQYTLSIFEDGELVKRKNRQSSVNDPISITVSTSRQFDDEAAISIRIRQDSGSPKTINSEDVATEFSIERHGI